MTASKKRSSVRRQRDYAFFPWRKIPSILDAGAEIFFRYLGSLIWVLRRIHGFVSAKGPR